MAPRQRRRQESPPIRPRHAYAQVAAAITATLLLGAFADRPIARWCSATFHGTALEQAIVAGFGTLDVFLPWTALLLVVLLVWRRVRPETPWLTHALSALIALWIALVATEALKALVGRSQVWPQYLQDGIYAFHPLTLHRGFMSFPSATMSGTTALVMGLGMPREAERTAAGAAIVFFASVLLITNGHWASDIVGGVILGLVVGRMVSRRFFMGLGHGVRG